MNKTSTSAQKAGQQQVAKVSIFVVVIILSMYIVQGSAQGISPALQPLANIFTDKPYSSIALFNTIVSLVSIITNLSVGFFVKKFGYKLTCFVGTLVYIIGGCLPFFFVESYGAILVCRIIMGLGYGILFPIGGSLCTNFIKDDKFRGVVMGWGSIVSQGNVMIFSTVGGILCSMGVKYNFLVNLIMLIPLVLCLFIPKQNAQKIMDEAVANDDARKEKLAEKEAVDDGPTKMNGTAVFSIVFYGILVLFVYALYLNTSKIVETTGMGTSVQSGLVISLNAVGGMIAGVIYPFVTKIFKNRTIAFSLIGMAIFYYVMSIATNIGVMYIGSLLMGLTFSFSMVFLFMGVSLNCPKSKTVFGFGIQMAFKCLMAFCAGYFYPFVAGLLGQSDNVMFPFRFSAILCIILGIIFVIKPVDILGLKKKKN